jgi:hypothetical protein
VIPRAADGPDGVRPTDGSCSAVGYADDAAIRFTFGGRGTLKPTNANGQRLAGLTILVLFSAALLSPSFQYMNAGPTLGASVEMDDGWALAAFGWAGPLGLCFAWFANIPLVACVFKMLRGIPPRRRVSMVSTCLALSVLLPHFIPSFVDGWHAGYLRGPAVWLWLSCFGILLFASKAPPVSRTSEVEELSPRSRHS